jgi:hypothetical protein
VKPQFGDWAWKSRSNLYKFIDLSWTTTWIDFLTLKFFYLKRSSSIRTINLNEIIISAILVNWNFYFKLCCETTELIKNGKVEDTHFTRVAWIRTTNFSIDKFLNRLSSDRFGLETIWTVIDWNLWVCYIIPWLWLWVSLTPFFYGYTSLSNNHEIDAV